MRPIVCLLTALFVAPAAHAGETPSYRLEIQARGFAPAALAVPSGVRIKLLVRNARGIPSEFESFDLNREKVVLPGTTVTVWIGPLSAGKYKVFDDFNPGVTGWIVARKPTAGGG